MEHRSGDNLVVEVALEPTSEADREKLRVALQKLAAEGPPFRVSTDPESGQTILHGESESALDRIVGLLIDEEVQLECGAPQVAYRETLGRKTEIDYTHKKQTGGSGQFARIKLAFEPGEPGSGYVFENRSAVGSIPETYLPGVKRGLESAKDNGLLAGFPLIDFKATLVDGAYHHEDSSALAFEIAARAAFRELREKGSPTLLEPVMKVEVAAPEDCVRAILSDLKGRGGQIQNRDVRDNAIVVSAMVPLANMFGYGRDLGRIAQDRAEFAMAFDHYAPVPLGWDDTPGPFAPAAAMRA